MNLKDLIKTNVQANLGDTMQLVRVTSNKSSDQVSGSLSRIVEKIKKLKLNSKKLDKGIEALNVLASVHVSKVAVNASLLDDLEKNFSILSQVQEQIDACNSSLEALKSFGPKVAAKAIAEVKSLLEHSQEQYEIIRQKLSKLSKEKRPEILAGVKGSLLYDILLFMKKEIDKYNKNNDANVEFGYNKSTYMAEEVAGTKRIRFVRYIPISNIPTFAEKTRNLFVAFATLLPNQEDLDDPESVEKALKKMKISMTLIPEIVRPGTLNDIKIVNSVTEVKGYLEYLCDHFGVSLFEISMEGNDKARIEKYKEGTYKILDKPGVKVKTKGSIITVTIPKGIYRKITIDGQLEPSFEKDLLLDMQLFCGFKKNKAFGRVKLLTPKPAMNRDGSIVLQYKRTETSNVDIKKMKVDTDKLPNNEWNDDIDWLEELRRQAAKYK